MLAEISAGFSSLRAATDIVKGLNAVVTETAVNQAKLDLQRLLLEAQQSLFASQEAQTAAAKRVGELEAEIARMKDWSADMQRYELKKFYPGTLVYVLKTNMAAGEPIHSLCKHCYDRGIKSVLQATSKSELRFRIFSCHACRNEVHMGNSMSEDADQRFSNEIRPPQLVTK